MLRNVCKSWYGLFVGLVGLTLIATSWGCGVPMDPLPEVSKEDRALVTKSSNAFALDLYKELASTQKDNLFFSPYSISSALTMTYAGAKGDTATEMAKVLHLSGTQKDVHKANGWLLIDLNNRGRLGNYQLSIANSLWGQAGYSFVPDFLTMLKTYYLADLTSVDFVKDAEAARKTINDWVSQKTNGKIEDLIPKGVINKLTRLVLTNAIYFKAEWLGKFKKDDTQDRDFHTSETTKVSVPTMYQKTDKAKHADFDKLQVLELPYKGKELSMIILLPKKKEGLKDVEKDLNDQNLNKWIGALQSVKDYRIFLPKFKFTKQIGLSATLQKLGIKKAFGSGADFSGINGKKDLFIQDVLHKAFIDVNEEGSEAAAATAVVMGVKSAPMNTLIRVDRPFIFMIHDKTTNTVLFMGRINNPK